MDVGKHYIIKKENLILCFELFWLNHRHDYMYVGFLRIQFILHRFCIGIASNFTKIP